MIIDHRALNDGTLTALIEQFLHREDHRMGDEDKDLTATINLIKTMLNTGEMHLTFDTKTESVNLLSTDQLAKLEPE